MRAPGSPSSSVRPCSSPSARARVPPSPSCWAYPRRRNDQGVADATRKGGSGMSLTDREFWGLIHGMGAGAVFLLAFAGGLAGLWSLRPGLVTDAGIPDRVWRLKIGTWVMAGAAWGTVVTGEWV